MPRLIRRRCPRRSRWRGTAAALGLPNRGRTPSGFRGEVPPLWPRRAFRGQASASRNPGGCAVASRSAASSCGVGSAPQPDIGNGRGTRAPEPSPRAWPTVLPYKVGARGGFRGEVLPLWPRRAFRGQASASRADLEPRWLRRGQPQCRFLLWRRQRPAAGHWQRPWMSRHPGSRTAAAARIHEQSAFRIRHRVEGGGHRGQVPEAISCLLRRELDLQRHAPAMDVPRPLLGAVGQRGLGQTVAVSTLPRARREGPVEDFDRQPRVHMSTIAR